MNDCRVSATLCMSSHGLDAAVDGDACEMFMMDAHVSCHAVDTMPLVLMHALIEGLYMTLAGQVPNIDYTSDFLDTYFPVFCQLYVRARVVGVITEEQGEET